MADITNSRRNSLFTLFLSTTVSNQKDIRCRRPGNENTVCTVLNVTSYGKRGVLVYNE